MNGLAERTKVRKTNNFESRTTSGWDTRPHVSGLIFAPQADSIDADIYTIHNNSSRLQAIADLGRPSTNATEIMKKIFRFANLQRGWDGNEAIPPSVETISKALAFIGMVDDFDLPFYFTAPGPNGEIVVEFKAGPRTAEVYINEDGSTEMMLYIGKEQLYADAINLETLYAHLLT